MEANPQYTISDGRFGGSVRSDRSPRLESPSLAERLDLRLVALRAALEQHSADEVGNNFL